MELIVISGFLGSGKTTILLSLARAFSEQGRKVAVIENEIGKDGVDGELLKAEGLSVREIYSGCICCSLRHDLVQTLLELEREYQPDVVFLEPSGVAGPKQIQFALNGYGGEIDRKTMVVVADAERLPAIRDFSIPLVHDGLEIADLVVLNKIDLVSERQLKALKERIEEINPDVTLLEVSSVKDIGIAALSEWIASAPLKSIQKVAEDSDGAKKLPSASVFASSRMFSTSNPEGEQHLSAALEQLSLEFPPEEEMLIGHIKAIVKTDPIGYSVFSITGHGKKATQKGRIPDTFTECKLTLNAIVYGVEEEILSAICNRYMDQLTLKLTGEG